MSFDFRNVAKAPKGTSGGHRCLPAVQLAYELAVAVLRLSLSPGRPPINRASVQAVSPVLAAAYVNAQSTIPTYLGQGRSQDGLGLHRPKAGPYPVCRENAALALSRLEQLGYPPAAVAALLGLSDEEALLAAVAALPDYAAASAALLATARPTPAPAAQPGPAAEPPGRKETAREAKERAKQEEQARQQADIAEVTAARTPPREPLSEQDEAIVAAAAQMEE